VSAKLPTNVEAERAVLGAVLVEPRRTPEAVAALRPDDFSEAVHRSVFEAVAALSARSEPIDFITVGEELARLGRLQSVGGRAGLVELSTTVTSGAHLPHHAKIVAACAALRRMIAASTAIANEAIGVVPMNGNVSEFLSGAAERLVAAADMLSPGGLELLDNEVRVLRSKIAAGPVEGLDGLRTGHRELDAIVCGIRPSDLVVIAARPGGGKTALASGIALHHALAEEPLPVAFFSLEMSRASLLERFVSARSAVDHYLIRTRKLSRERVELVERALFELERAPLSIDDSRARTIMSIRAEARRLKKRRGLGLVVVDYLQLVENPNAENRLQEVSSVSRGLKALAMELNVPVIAAAQLNRSADGGPDQRPRLSHLRESGSIEADADIVVLLHAASEKTHATDPRTIEAIVAKNRNGPMGLAGLLFQPNLVRFVDVAMEWP
jgi:replicative DNA helicase